MTVGDIYERSPLARPTIASRRAQVTGRRSLEAEGQEAWPHGRTIDGRETTVPFNRSIDSRPLRGC
jgi:hypothetical protein